MKLAQLNGKPEIFHSIQGEGKSQGMPCVFIRSTICNLQCYWCDTDYTWNWEDTDFKHRNDLDPSYKKYNKLTSIIELQPNEIAQEVFKFNCLNIVITGGEPLVQQSSWVELMTLLRKADSNFWFEVETNGTVKPLPEFENLINQYNVSPKLSNSRMEKAVREKNDALSYFAQNPKSNFKFVIDAKKDLEEVLEYVDKYNLPSPKIYLMPEGTKSELLKEKQEWIVEICKQHNFNYTDRLHVHIYGAKRGV